MEATKLADALRPVEPSSEASAEDLSLTQAIMFGSGRPAGGKFDDLDERIVGKESELVEADATQEKL